MGTIPPVNTALPLRPAARWPLLVPTVLVVLLALPCPPSLALLLGALAAALAGTPAWAAPAGTRLLQLGIVLLGAGMDLAAVLRTGAGTFLPTLGSLLVVFALALPLGRLLRLPRDLTLLLAAGTGICGGSAIAAGAAALRARPGEAGAALAVVLLLNGSALVLFPPLGALCGLSPDQFGRWCALAIHDTSSVVGAAASGGDAALAVATTTKLARALWIVPVSLLLARFSARGGHAGRGPAARPWFLLWFLLTSLLVSALPALRPVGEAVATGGRHLLTAALFLLGTSLAGPLLRQLGLRPLLLGVLLWAVLASGSLLLVR